MQNATPPPQEHCLPGQEPCLPDDFPLRDGLVIHTQGTGRRVVLEDTQREKYFRLGQAEGAFVAALIQSGSPKQAHETCSRDESQREFSIEEVGKLCKWLAANGLVAQDSGMPSAPPPPARNPLAAAFFWKVSLFNPDRVLAAIVQHVGWLFSAQAMLIGVAVCVLAMLRTIGHWAEFFASYENLFSSWRWVTLAIGWVVLKLIHEIAHGATCRRYGGEVKDCGLAMILLMPIAFVNVTSSWRFASRWQRLHVTLAGIAAELFIAGIALFTWHWLGSTPLKQAAADIFMLASISSLLFNLNPLLKFDGYFALADATGIDNLYTYGQRYARYFGGRYVLGLDAQPPKLPGSRPGWIKLYGLSAALYRVITVSGLLVGAAAIFHGAGIVIAIAGAGSFIFKPLMMLVKHLRQLRQNDNADMTMEPRLSLTRLSLRLTCVAALIVAPLFLIPANWSWTAPAIVQYDPPTVLRTRSPGFVQTVHAFDGDHVDEGDPIVTLRNDDLRLSLSELQKQLAQTEQEILSAQWRSDSSVLFDAQSREVALREQVAELKMRVSSLTLRAPAYGTLIARGLSLRAGTYLPEGEELGLIGREDSKRLKVCVSQSDAKQADRWSQHPLRVMIDGQDTWTCKLWRMETRADIAPPHPALLAINGGSLATVQTEDEIALCEPRVNGYIKLTAHQSRSVTVGRRAHVRIDADGQSIGMACLNYVTNMAPIQFFRLARFGFVQ